MNVVAAADEAAVRIMAEYATSTAQPDRVLLRLMLGQAFATGVIYGIGRAQHAVAITHATAESQTSADKYPPAPP